MGFAAKRLTAKLEEFMLRSNSLVFAWPNKGNGFGLSQACKLNNGRSHIT
jgi:hypothetical protein